MSGRGRRAVPSGAALTRALEEGFRGPCWHGPAVRSVVRGVNFQLAQFRLQPARNSTWDIVLHLAYARHRALLHIVTFRGQPRQRFPRAMRNSWWPQLPSSLTQESWEADQALLKQQYRLLDALVHLPGEVLHRKRRGQKWPYGTEILGLATHDSYHAGQLGLITRTASER